jgi:hypothetical protein
MAEHKVQGGNMLLFIDPLGGTDYSTVVCLTSVSTSDSISVVDASSACGPDKSPGTLEISYAFEGQHLQDPTSSKISIDLRLLLRNETTIGWALSPEIPQPGDEIQFGTGYLSELSSTYAFDSVGTFTGTIQPYGTPSITIVGGGGGGFTLGQNYQGGKIAYIDGTGLHGIIVANDIFASIWSESNDDFSSLLWDYGQGAINTSAIIAGISINPSNSAAYIADQYTSGGYNDWFLPSIDDINNMYFYGGLAACGYTSQTIWPSNDTSPAFTFKSYGKVLSDGSWPELFKNQIATVIPSRYF